MRGQADDQLPLFHLFSLEDRIRADHPLRNIKCRVDRIMAGMSPQFAKAYSVIGRPSVSPEPAGGPVEVAADVGDWGGGVPSGAIAEAEARVKRKEG